jgi:hypothetical protein
MSVARVVTRICHFRTGQQESARYALGSLLVLQVYATSRVVNNSRVVIPFDSHGRGGRGVRRKREDEEEEEERASLYGGIKSELS